MLVRPAVFSSHRTYVNRFDPVKYTNEGGISVQCRAFDEPDGLRNVGNVAVEIIVSDTGCGISSDKLESIFREFEQVDATPQPVTPPSPKPQGLGMSSGSVLGPFSTRSLQV